ncbi:hypothetical protein [Streptomyces sp. NPDC059063]|uniref:hypothetical protein n=1 Tax=Streptomyces sp. NPDC059063 TaxID=3346712 RepID=UPI0036ACD35C
MEETATVYYRGADGVLAERTASGAGAEAPTVPGGAKRLSAKAYRAALEDVRAARQEHAAALQAGDEERLRGDFEALRAAGIPEATARRLSGYTAEEGVRNG